MKKEKILLASMLFANAQIQLELIDRLKGTSLYRQSLKNQYNKVQKENEKLINSFHTGMNHEAEMMYYQITRTAENFVLSIEKKDINVVDAFLKDYLNDRLKIETE